MPVTSPAKTLIVSSPAHPANVVEDPDPPKVPPMKLCETPSSHDHVNPCSLSGPRKVQKPVAIAAPVSVAAMNPARLLRGASGRRPKRRLGRGGVRLP